MVGWPCPACWTTRAAVAWWRPPAARWA
ncbi:TPA: DUF2752 domain-containing protein [Stenotrophomonas maltophilia]|nr:DUF2752 domain-containing protein [Stenotrophomonas maltophilia]